MYIQLYEKYYYYFMCCCYLLSLSYLHYMYIYNILYYSCYIVLYILVLHLYFNQNSKVSFYLYYK